MERFDKQELNAVANPRGKKQINEILLKKGWVVYRFWEHEVMDPENEPQILAKMMKL